MKRKRKKSGNRRWTRSNPRRKGRPTPAVDAAINRAHLRLTAEATAIAAEQILTWGARYVANRIFEWMMAVPSHGFRTGLAAAGIHPEEAEPIKTKIDERQLGRSEVIGELARPKSN